MPRIIDDETEEPQARETVREPKIPHIVHDHLPVQREAETHDHLPTRREIETKVRDEESVLTGLSVPRLEDLNSILDPFAPAPLIPHQKEK